MDGPVLGPGWQRINHTHVGWAADLKPEAVMQSPPQKPKYFQVGKFTGYVSYTRGSKKASPEKLAG